MTGHTTVAASDPGRSILPPCSAGVATMLRLRNQLLSAIRAASHLPAASSLPRHLLLLPLSTAAASPAPFVVEDYLITTCGLTPAQALKSSKHLAHLKSPSNADAVLAFFADAGLEKADVAAAIAREPRILCSRVDATLKPRIGMLRDIGLSRSQISSLVAVAPDIYRRPSGIPRLEFLLSFLGSYEKVHTVLKRDHNHNFLTRDIERVVKPNIAFLQQSGLTDCEIAKIFEILPVMVSLQPERVKEIVVCAGKLGVPRDSAMFKYALMSIYSISPERIGPRFDFLKKTLGCSKAELSAAVHKLPYILKFSEDKLKCLINFLRMKVGVETEYILHRPALLTYSLKKRLMPRHYVLEVLKEKGLLKKDIDFYNVVCLTENRFAKKFLDPYKEGAPGLAAAYAEQIPQIKS